MDWSKCTQSTSDGSQVASLKCIEVVLSGLINYAFAFAGSVAAIIIILAGIQFIRSRGDPKGLQSARQAMTWGIIGLVIILLAYIIVTFIGFVTGTTNSCVFSFLNGAALGSCQ